MELFQLRYFVAAARLGSFTRAAEACFVSQPSLSQQIANLEGELGIGLFLRRGRGVELTEGGLALLLHADRILAEEQSARAAVQEVAGLRRGRLTLWTLPTPGQQLLPPLLAMYRRRHPGIEISLRETVPARAVAEAVEAGLADVGVVHLPYQVEGLEQRTLLVEEMALVTPVGHPLAQGDPVPLAAAANEDFIWAPEGANVSHPLYAACLAAGFEPHIACVSGSALGMQSLVAAGLGIALLPRLAIHPPDGACIVELAPPRPTRTLVAIWRADRLSRAAAAFLDCLAEPATESR